METFQIGARIKNYRIYNQLTQELLAEKSGLNLRTIQRIEKGETIPRGDTLMRLSEVLNVGTDDLTGWNDEADQNLRTVLSISQLSFIAFPILGIVVPLLIWVSQREKSTKIDKLGKLILNFQVTWTLMLCVVSGLMFLGKILHLPWHTGWLPILFSIYAYNFIVIMINTYFARKGSERFFGIAVMFLT